jgi:alkaline phosphatase D
VDVFLLDDRWWRANDNLPDSVDGRPNSDKTMFGKEQMDWLKNALLSSKSNRNISFRIIATGSQVLNPVSRFDVFKKFEPEYNDFMEFLKEAKIPGIVFLTGDRHHSEIIEVKQAGMYPLYDITSSPLTSGTHVFGGPEANNPFRVVGVDQFQNYARISFSGAGKERTMQVSFIGLKGEVYKTWSIQAQNLSF